MTQTKICVKFQQGEVAGAVAKIISFDPIYPLLNNMICKNSFSFGQTFSQSAVAKSR